VVVVVMGKLVIKEGVVPAAAEQQAGHRKQLAVQKLKLSRSSEFPTR
jgi:hypothetical protein